MTLEPLHDVIYFAPGVRDAGAAIGLKGFWMGYFAFRAAPMGPVGPAVVSANFANFQPAMVARALPDAWPRAMPDACLRTRQDIATHALRSIGVDEHACRLAVELLAPAITSGDVTGRPLFAANAALPIADDPVTALWQTATTLREHRGDGHVAALACHGMPSKNAPPKVGWFAPYAKAASASRLFCIAQSWGRSRHMRTLIWRHSGSSKLRVYPTQTARPAFF